MRLVFILAVLLSAAHAEALRIDFAGDGFSGVVEYDPTLAFMEPSRQLIYETQGYFTSVWDLPVASVKLAIGGVEQAELETVTSLYLSVRRNGNIAGPLVESIRLSTDANYIRFNGLNYPPTTGPPFAVAFVLTAPYGEFPYLYRPGPLEDLAAVDMAHYSANAYYPDLLNAPVTGFHAGVVPEPGAGLLFGVALAMIGADLRRSR